MYRVPVCNITICINMVVMIKKKRRKSLQCLEKCGKHKGSGRILCWRFLSQSIWNSLIISLAWTIIYCRCGTFFCGNWVTPYFNKKMCVTTKTLHAFRYPTDCFQNCIWILLLLWKFLKTRWWKSRFSCPHTVNNSQMLSGFKPTISIYNKDRMQKKSHISTMGC